MLATPLDLSSIHVDPMSKQRGNSDSMISVSMQSDGPEMQVLLPDLSEHPLSKCTRFFKFMVFWRVPRIVLALGADVAELCTANFTGYAKLKFNQMIAVQGAPEQVQDSGPEVQLLEGTCSLSSGARNVSQ